jgi:dihydrofolate reductase
MPKPLHLIVACAENRVIGRKERQPWRIPEDMNFFHEQTAGRTVILGRICFETWPRATRDGRQPIVVTRNTALAGEGVRVVTSFAEAVATADASPEEIYVCGGQRIYEEALALAPTRPLRLHLTLIHARISGDRFFPEWRQLPWRELSRRESADDNYRYTFFDLALEPT